MWWYSLWLWILQTFWNHTFILILINSWQSILRGLWKNSKLLICILQVLDLHLVYWHIAQRFLNKLSSQNFSLIVWILFRANCYHHQRTTLSSHFSLQPFSPVSLNALSQLWELWCLMNSPTFSTTWFSANQPLMQLLSFSLSLSLWS